MTSSSEKLKSQLVTYDQNLFYLYKGVVIPKFVTQRQLRYMATMTLRPDDVWVVTYPKSGTTWAQKIVYLIQNEARENGRKLTRNVPWVETLGYDGRTKSELSKPIIDVELLPSPRAFKSHFSYHLMPCGAPNTTPCKYVCVARNPKDVAVSYYYHYQAYKFHHHHTAQLEWDTFFQLFVAGQVAFGDYFSHVLSWWAHKDDKNVLFIKFEDMKKDLFSAVSEIAAFMGYNLSTEMIDNIVSRTTFDAMRDDSKSNYSWTRRDPTVEPFMRKGVVGDWRRHFSTEQSEMFDRLYEEQIRGSGLEFEFNERLKCHI